MISTGMAFLFLILQLSCCSFAEQETPEQIIAESGPNLGYVRMYCSGFTFKYAEICIVSDLLDHYEFIKNENTLDDWILEVSLPTRGFFVHLAAKLANDLLLDKQESATWNTCIGEENSPGTATFYAGLMQKLMDYVDCGALTCQLPSVLLSGRNIEGSIYHLLFIPTFLILWMIKWPGGNKDLRVTFPLEQRHVHVVLLCLSVSTCTKALPVSLQQTAPDNSVICPGQLLVYSCVTNSTGSIQWQTTGKPSVVFNKDVAINFTLCQEQFCFRLTGIALGGAVLTSTATSSMASSALDGLQIECSNGFSVSTLYVDVADGPDSCQNLSIQYGVIGIPMDISEVEVEIHLSTNSTFMCAVNYLIQLDEENKTVPIDSPSVNFTIKCAEQKTSLEVVIYTLDNESRPGAIPCNFNIPGPSAVENVEVQECNTDYVLIAWTISQMSALLFHSRRKASMIAGSLSNDTRLEYRVHFHFTGHKFLHVTRNLSSKLPIASQFQDTPLQVNITPVLFDIQLVGTPLSTTLTTEVVNCLGVAHPDTTTTTTTTSTTTTAAAATATPSILSEGHDSEVVIYLYALIAVTVILFSILLALLLSMVWIATSYKRWLKKAIERSDQERKFSHADKETPAQDTAL